MEFFVAALNKTKLMRCEESGTPSALSFTLLSVTQLLRRG